MMTAVHGILAAGTAAYLTREATWEKIAFTSNHLFLLVGVAAHAAAVEIPYFSLAAKVVFCVTPIVLIEHFRQGQVSTPKAKAIGHYFNRFYYAAAVISTLVLVRFGHTAYGVGFFSVMALDMLSRGRRVNAYVKSAFEWSATATALLTFASYAAKLATPRGHYIMALVGAQAFLPRICKFIQDVLSASGGSASLPQADLDEDDDHLSQERKFLPWGDPWQMRFTRYMMMPVGFVSSQPLPRSESGAFMHGLQNLMGPLPLPHDM